MTEKKLSEKRIFYESIDSTNEEMQRILQKTDVEEGTVIFTGYQTSGKGYMGNSWESEKDKNLLISILLHPDFLYPSEQFCLLKVLSLALMDIVGLYCKEVLIRWPNDIYIKGKKIAGILIENIITGDSITSSIAGIGLNVNQDRFSKEIPNPTSFCLETGCQFDMTKLLDQLMKQVELWYNRLYRKEQIIIDQAYIENLYGFGEIKEFVSKKTKFAAKITGVEHTGELVLETKDKKKLKFGFREVSYR